MFNSYKKEAKAMLWPQVIFDLSVLIKIYSGRLFTARCSLE